MKRLVSLGLVALCLALAAARPARADAPQDSIFDRATTIRGEVYRSTASPDDLRRADDLMAEALRLILSSGGSNADCIGFAYQKYYVDYSASVSQDKAAAACRLVADEAVAEFLWAKFYIDYSSSVAMDKAADGASRGVTGKLPIVQFAWSKYYVDYSASVAATKAGDGTKLVSSGAVSCIQTAWTNYYVDYSSSVAMDKAFAACR